MQIAAVVIAALLALAVVYVYSSGHKSGAGAYGVTITVQIYGAIPANTTLNNSTTPIPASYDPLNFTVFKGEQINLRVQNTDNLTHGLAVPKFNLDTGPMKPNATVTLTFTPTATGNYTYYEPSADCGGGNCDSGQALSGWFLVES